MATVIAASRADAGRGSGWRLIRGSDGAVGGRKRDRSHGRSQRKSAARGDRVSRAVETARGSDRSPHLKETSLRTVMPRSRRDLHYSELQEILQLENRSPIILHCITASYTIVMSDGDCNEILTLKYLWCT